MPTCFFKNMYWKIQDNLYFFFKQKMIFNEIDKVKYEIYNVKYESLLHNGTR